MNKSDIVYLIKVLIIWKLIIFLSIYLAPRILVLNQSFLGGRVENYLTNPFFWSATNFDGEHYISIARRGYQNLTYFYFPLYPILIRMLNYFNNLVLTGVILSNFFLVSAVVGFYKLLKLDYNNEVVNKSLLLMIFFPASFYFGAVYTESLFLMLTIWCFYFARKKLWLRVGMLGLLACLTRVVGLAIFPAILFEFYLNYSRTKVKERRIYQLLYILLIPTGIFIYMYYLFIKTGDPLDFMNSVGLFGDQRSAHWVFYPQVLYRYIFKIFPNYNWNYFPGIFTTISEFLISIIFGFLAIASIYKTRISYAIYFLLAYMIPTLAGSFSSMSRYAIVLFPAYIIMARLIDNKLNLKLLLVIMIIGLFFSNMLFASGYWYA